MKPSAVLLSAVLLFPAGLVSAGEDDGVPWGSADYAQEFSYLRESSPELEESWDSLGEKDQKSRLQSVKAPAAERYKEVLADYKEAMKKWDLRELQKALEGDPKARAGTFSNWIDDEAAEAYLRKFSAVRSTLRKAETQPLEEADVAVLERYLLPEVVETVKTAKASYDKDAGVKPKAASSVASSGGLDHLAGSGGGNIESGDLSGFYDNADQHGGTGTPGGAAGAPGTGDGKILALAADRGSTASTIKHTAPESIGGSDGDNGPAKVKSGKGRPLNDTELEAARSIYGDKIDYSKVRIITGKDMTLWGRILTHGGAAVTWGNTIYYPNENGVSVYNPETMTDWNVHEMTHVYQYQKDGWSYAAKSVIEQLRKGQGAYSYQLEPGKPFNKYGIEQQARMVQDYYSGSLSDADSEQVAALLRAQGLLK
ncbi:MAG: hypothetical protein M0025_07130 [Elusimicrobia bacterium]|nr:hypothetical protein [Elusimicrobiota bacterium]